jgi:hypothetical protein
MTHTLEGMVVGASAGNNADGSWDLALSLCPWRESGGPVSNKPLRVDFPMKDLAAASGAMDEWDGKAVSVRLRIFERPSPDRPRGVAHAELPIESIEPDAEMQAAARERARPRSVDDIILGTLTLDRRVDWYAGTRKANGGSYRVAVSTDDPDDDVGVIEAIRRAGAIVEQIDRDSSSGRLLDAIADQMLDLYNDTWRDEGPPLSRTAFKQRFTLSSVVVRADSSSTAWFDCDESLFGGHAVQVRNSPHGEVTEVCLAG